jgi:hypothetical protein
VSAVIVRNSREGEAPADPPRHDDGALYPYAMFYDGLKYIAYADDLVDLLETLSPGYQEKSEGEQLQARIRLAIDAQVGVQANINANIDPEKWNALSEEDRAVLTGPRYEQPRVDFWDPEVPLVVVESGYAPYTDIDQPISGIADVQNPPNMIWLRPIDEWDLLTSLHDAGFITLHQATDL